MNYGEAAYFEGNHCQHVVAYENYIRLKRIAKQWLDAIAGRR